MSNGTGPAIDPRFQGEREEEPVNLRELVFRYLAYWKWFVVSVIACVFCGYVYLRYSPVKYSIKASILVKDEKKGIGQDAMLKELDIFGSNKVVENEMEILRSFTLMSKVVHDLNLNIRYYSKKKVKDSEIYNNCPVLVELVGDSGDGFIEPIHLHIVGGKTVELDGKPVELNKEIKLPEGIIKINLTGKDVTAEDIVVRIQSEESMTEALLLELKVEPSSKMSTVLMMSIEDNMSQRGVEVLDYLIKAYNEASLEDKNKVASNTLVFIEERLRLLSGDLNKVEQSVEEFKSKEGITNISEEGRLFLQSVQENDMQISQAKIQLSVLNSVAEYVKKKDNQPGTVPATLGISDPTLLSLIAQLSQTELQRERTLKLTREDNPLVLALDDQIRMLKKSILENIETLRKNINLTLEQLGNQNAKLESFIRSIPGKERILVDITRQQAIKNNLYIFLLEKREETALSFASAVSDSRTIDSARSTSLPVKPVRKVVYLLSFVLGLALPFGAIYISDLFNDKVRSREDIARATHAPVIGEISFAKDAEGIIVDPKSRTAVVEQIRALRTNLAFSGAGSKVQSILFTSGMSGEGKSFISLNLGAGLAMTGKKTVILELDMRRPKIHRSLNLSAEKGLSNYLIGAAHAEEIIQQVPGHENFYMIPCGPVPPNPVEILLNGKIEELIEELRRKFDYIIIDTPPIGIVTDAQILAKSADVTIYVLRHNYTPKSNLLMLEELYRGQKFHNLHLVFNAIKEGSRYGYKYGYGYGYGGYGVDEKQKS
ncbi:MAG: polysaccharide biosynthesis tyrosine autokinase [Bacteroidia bacterium]|nr:polysaccharide biosynthesis tyrosine autokinase [Bacteroidia bacterium]